MRKLSVTYFLLLASYFSYATGGEYAVSNIPEALKKDANVVQRTELIKVEIVSYTKIKFYHKYAVTILNENGDAYAGFGAGYDKFRSIESIEGTLYDASGNKIRVLKKNEIQDYSGVSGVSLMDDNRIKAHNFFYKAYPYTVEYEMEMVFNNTYIMPDWNPQAPKNYSVEQSMYIVLCPADFTFRYKAFNYPGEPAIKQEKDLTSYTWEIKNLPALKTEFASPDWHTLTTSVFVSANKFQIEKYSGDMSSWENYGRFIYQLNQGRDELPDDVKQTVHQLTDKLTDPVEKIIALYEYMQKHTRYVSIQFGIGGIRPFDAQYVASKSYGDCKALSNYMYSLLKEANIKSHYTLIKSGEGEKFFLPDFPSNQFDHVILCVPMEKDTVWLECTSQTIAPGYLGDFTDDRYALMIDEDGGKLIRTPRYGLKDNLQQRTVNAKLNEDGLLTAEIRTTYSGMKQDNLQMLINDLSKDKMKEYLDEELEFATYTVNNFDYKEKKGSLPEIEEKLNVGVDHYATISGKRLFIVPDIMTRSHRKLKSDVERKYDIDLDIEYTDIDKIEIEIPSGYVPESMPQDAAIETKFGRYKSSVKLDKNKIIYSRRMEQFSGLFPKTDYTEMVNFYDAVYKADRNKLVFVKTEEEKKPF